MGPPTLVHSAKQPTWHAIPPSHGLHVRNNEWQVPDMKEWQSPMWLIEPPYGMPGVIVDGMDVVAVYEATRIAVAKNKTAKAHRDQYRLWNYDHAGVSGLGKIIPIR